MNPPTEAATLERARSLADHALWTVSLQARRIRSTEPEDEDFLFRQEADFQFLIVILRRLRRAVSIATHVPSVADTINKALQQFDNDLPGLGTMRNIGEHIDAYALDHPKRHDPTISRSMLQVAAWDDHNYRWLGIELNTNDALKAGQRLYRALRKAQTDHLDRQST